MLEFQKHIDPWLHYTTTNFLPENMFIRVKHIFDTKIDTKTPNKETITNVGFKNPNMDIFFRNLYPKFCNLLDIEIFDSLRIDFQFTCLNNTDHSQRYDQGIHLDSYAKQLSCLVQISESGSGTMLYDQNKNFVKQIEWKQNSAFLFANKPGFWHSAGMNNTTARCMLNVIYYPKNYRLFYEKKYNIKSPPLEERYK